MHLYHRLLPAMHPKRLGAIGVLGLDSWQAYPPALCDRFNNFSPIACLTVVHAGPLSVDSSSLLRQAGACPRIAPRARVNRASRYSTALHWCSTILYREWPPTEKDACSSACRAG